VTLGGDQGFDTADFVRECRAAPHVAQNLDSRTTRHWSYAKRRPASHRYKIPDVFQPC
jgi:hypothetical protein